MNRAVSESAFGWRSPVQALNSAPIARYDDDADRLAELERYDRWPKAVTDAAPTWIRFGEVASTRSLLASIDSRTAQHVLNLAVECAALTRCSIDSYVWTDPNQYRSLGGRSTGSLSGVIREARRR